MPRYLIILLLSFACHGQQKTAYHIRTIAFYPSNSLYDTINDPNTKDELHPIHKQKGNKTTFYFENLDHVASEIKTIGKDKTNESPTIIGLSNVENEQVLIDLLQTKALKNEKYEYIHVDSEDWMGRDLAILYKPKLFSIIDYQLIPLSHKSGKSFKSIGVLYIKGQLEGEITHILVTHWNKNNSEFNKKQINYAKYTLEENIKKILTKDKNAKIIIIGNFNKNPTDDSIQKLAIKNKLFNPYELNYQKGEYTSYFKRNPILNYQIILSSNFQKTKSNKGYLFYKSLIFNSVTSENNTKTLMRPTYIFVIKKQ